jgi:hypothetical protein
MKHLSEPPPHGVPRYRVADLTGYRETQPGSAELVRKGVHGEELAPVSGALTVDPLEFGRVGKACTLAPRQRLNCQALAAPAPAGRDDSASSHRTHALAEAVRLGSLTTIRLIGTLH